MATILCAFGNDHEAAEALRREGWEVLEAATTSEAQERLVTHRPDVLILDAALPAAQQLCVEIKARARMPVMLVAADSALLETDAARSADLCLALPIARRCLVSAVGLLLRRNQHTEERMRWQGVVEGIADEVWICDAQGKMSLINLPETTAMDLEEFENKTVQEVLEEIEILYLDGRPRPPEQAPLLRSLRSGEIVRGEEIMRHRKTGRTRYRQFSCAPMRDASGAITGAVAIVRDVTEQKRTQEERARALAELHATVSSMTDGMSVYRPDGSLAFTNPAGQRILGYPPDFRRPLSERIERMALAFEDRTPCPLEQTPTARALRGETVERVVMLFRRPDDEEVWLSVGAAPMVTAKGERIGAVTVFSDITERKRAEEELRIAKEQLEEADRRKNEFLAMLSHELRNPLAPIRSSLHVLDRAGAQTDRTRRARTIIERQVGHMTRLVGDLLDVSRITRGKIELRRERLDLREIANRTLEDHRPLFAACSIELGVEQPERPIWVNADPTRLAQAIGNLLENAAKFTPAGGSVTVRSKQEDETAVLSVRDTGVGISPDVMARLFEPFTQADRSLDRSSGGLGLGLSVVKGVVELHGGNVQATSGGRSRGSEFTLTLPAESAPSRPRPQVELVRPPARRVLVIEDNVDAAESLKEALELDEHEVAVAFSGPDGLAKARAFAPDVVFCDIGLPGMDGYEVARAIRSDDALHDIALVALTGYAAPEDRKMAANAGFDRHVAKPPDIDALERILAEVTNRHGA